jgi:hypothetical protein
VLNSCNMRSVPYFIHGNGGVLKMYLQVYRYVTYPWYVLYMVAMHQTCLHPQYLSEYRFSGKVLLYTKFHVGGYYISNQYYVYIYVIVLTSPHY